MTTWTTRGRIVLAASCALATGFASADANAADAADAPAAPEGAAAAAGGSLDEVVVTARYRSENVQSTPISITALSATALEDRGVTNVQNLSAIVPNTFIAPGAAGAIGAPTISMRGVQQVDFNFNFESPVGIYIDDVYRPHMLGSDIDLLDVDHIEVLRGPQGTLFGKSSMGGAIRLFSKQPTGGDTGSFEASAGNQGAYNFRGSFDTTLIADRLFMRVAGVYKHRDGYVDMLDFVCQMNANGTPNLIAPGVTSHWPPKGGCVTGREGEENVKGGRIMLRAVTSDKSEVTVALDRTNDDNTIAPDVTLATISQGAAVQQGYVAPGAVWDSRFLGPGRYQTYASPDTPNVQYLHEWGLAVTGTYNFTDHIRSKLIVGHRDYDSASSFNADASPLQLIQNWNPIQHSQDSVELRLTGEAFDNRLDWATGAYWFEGKTYQGGHIKFTTLNFDQDDHYGDRNESVFAHGVYNLTDKLSLTAGVRYSKNVKTFSYHHPGIGPDIAPIVSEARDDRPDWTGGINYKFTDALMTYASVSTGFRPGGVNPRAIVIPDQLRAFEGEQMTSYELGVKSQFLDNRLRANVAVFYSDYSKHLTQAVGKECIIPGLSQDQIRVYQSNEVCPGTTVAEVPWDYYITSPASVRGAEGEFVYEPLNRLRLEASFGYNHFKSKVTNPADPRYVDPANLQQPEWNANAAAQYGLPFAAGVLTPRLEWVYQSRMTFSGAPALPFDPRFGLSPQAAYDLTSTPARSLFNARIGFDSQDGKWGAALRVDNLFNHFYYLNKFDLSGLVVSGLPSRPRTWLLSVTRNFQ